MILEHEIPNGSKLYFGESAKVKRDIEYVASETLDNLGFEEIVTPLFSYHQHESFDNKKSLGGVIASLSISGVPPFNGFFSKWMVYQGVIQLGSEGDKLWVIWLAAAIP